MSREHPTWTHGYLVDRILSKITRAELVRHGYAASGAPAGGLVLPAYDERRHPREVARAELNRLLGVGRPAARGCGWTR